MNNWPLISTLFCRKVLPWVYNALYVSVLALWVRSDSRLFCPGTTLKWDFFLCFWASLAPSLPVAFLGPLLFLPCLCSSKWRLLAESWHFRHSFHQPSPHQSRTKVQDSTKFCPMEWNGTFVLESEVFFLSRAVIANAEQDFSKTFFLHLQNEIACVEFG